MNKLEQIKTLIKIIGACFGIEMLILNTYMINRSIIINRAEIYAFFIVGSYLISISNHIFNLKSKIAFRRIFYTNVNEWSINFLFMPIVILLSIYVGVNLINVVIPLLYGICIFSCLYILSYIVKRMPSLVDKYHKK